MSFGNHAIRLDCRARRACTASEELPHAVACLMKRTSGTTLGRSRHEAARLFWVPKGDSVLSSLDEFTFKSEVRFSSRDITIAQMLVLPKPSRTTGSDCQSAFYEVQQILALYKL